jgi:putative flippase GtrA
VLIRQFGKFVLVGVSNTALTFIAYAALIGLGLPYLAAGAIAFALGALNGYLLNRRWTFGRPDSASAPLKYVVVQLGGLGLTEVLLWLLATGAGLGRIVGFALTAPLVTAVTFLSNRNWTFQSSLRTSA